MPILSAPIPRPAGIPRGAEPLTVQNRVYWKTLVRPGQYTLYRPDGTGMGDVFTHPTLITENGKQRAVPYWARTPPAAGKPTTTCRWLQDLVRLIDPPGTTT